MKVLLACEESQAVCKEFRKLGHEAFSCDIQECSGGHPEWHYQQDVFEVINMGWDLMIAFPPCTYLSYAGNGWFNVDKYGDKAVQRMIDRNDALSFFMKLYNAPIDKICIENPRGYPMKFIKPTQVIHPYYFGDEDKKTTCLWLKNLPPLLHSAHDTLFYEKTHTKEPEPRFIEKSGKKRYFTDAFLPGKDRQKLRSKTFPGIARAMATTWGNL